MATYYRWRKSTVNYVASVDDSYSIGSLSIPNLDNKIYFSDNMPNIDGNGKFITNTSREISSETSVGFNQDQWVSNLENPTEMYSGNTLCKATVSGSDIVLTGYHSLPQPTFKKTVVNANIGTFVEYVYSTSSSAYPNGGVSGSYYYDQRTTVTSPTKPTGLTYPNPITTPTVTVSWQAATSNVPDYPVDHYNVYYGFTDAPASYLLGSTTGTSKEVSIPIGITSIKFEVEAVDSFGTTSGRTVGPIVNVYLAPTLTVPQMVMQGQQATISWSAIEGADSYTLQRKANTDTDWTQVYSGASLTFSETVGTWTTVQYRVQAVFSGTPGGWAESASIPVVSASSLVISGTDEDLGVVTNDIPYSISTDTGNQITATITVNNAVIFSGNVGNSTAGVIPVLDLITGEGTIVISATVDASGSPVTATRTWTYEKAAITFPNSGSVAQVTKEGENIYPKVLAEGVRLPGGKTLDQVMGFPAQIYTGSYVGTGTSGASNPNTLTFPFEPKVVFVCQHGEASGTLIPMMNPNTISIGIRHGISGYVSLTVSWGDKSVSWYGESHYNQFNYSGYQYDYVVIG